MATRAESVAPSWKEGRFLSWLTTVDHKRIGIIYIATAFLWFFGGGAMALALRLQLAQANQDIVTGDSYNSLFTMHGTVMVFLFAMPLLAGVATYVVPLQIGAPDMAFPRLNAFTLWIYLLSAFTLMVSFAAEGGAARTGWTAYAPLSATEQYSPGVGQDLWILGLLLIGVSSALGGINFIVTIVNMRTPGMTMTRMPLFCWAILAFAILIVLTIPVIAAALLLLILDRQAGTSFFLPDDGGSAVLWQHLFWFFGHPEVYILILPVFGIISEVIPVFSRKPIFGYRAVAVSSLAIAFIALIVWAHHMFTVGLSSTANSYFMIATFFVAVPTGVKIINWIATLWRGNLSFPTPMLFAIGFIALFVMGGLSGIFLGNWPIDLQLHDSYYVVAHFHYTLFGGMVFGILAGIHYWFPKMTGRMYDETLGKVTFWLLFIGFNLTFIPQHMAGLLGMPRRIYTYEREGLFETYNLLSTIGAWVMGVAILLFVINMVRSWRKGPRVGPDPWKADTLEWYADSPPAAHNFGKIPYVTSHRPLRDLRLRIRDQR